MVSPTTSATWSFDVALSTHDLLKRGVVVATWRRVVVQADDYVDASLLAYALAASVTGRHPRTRTRRRRTVSTSYGEPIVTDVRWRY